MSRFGPVTAKIFTPVKSMTWPKWHGETMEGE